MKPLNKIATAFAAKAFCAAAVSSAIFACATLVSIPAFAGGAHAGDGVYVNGQLKMRDFIETNKANGLATGVQNNKKFLEDMPGFMPLFKEIAAADPVFAFEIWKQLNDVRIWLIPSKLPLLPLADTTVVGPNPQVQIAIHYSHDIMISTTALAQLPPTERPYEMIHEALHGLIRGNGPIHEMRVMFMTKWLHDHRGHYTTATLDDELARVGVKDSNFAIDSADIWHLNDFNRVLSIYLQQLGTTQSLCLLRQTLTKVMDYNVSFIASLYGPDNCPAQDQISAIKSFSPTLAHLLNQFAPFDISSDVSGGNVQTSNIDIDDLSQWTPSKAACRSNANPALSGTIESAILKYQSLIALAKQGKRVLNRIHKMLYSNYTQDPAQVAAVYLYITVPPLQGLFGQYYTPITVNHLNNLITKSQEMISGPLATAQEYLKNNITICLNKYDQY